MGIKRIASFQQELWAFYNEHGRDLPWRQTIDPYHVLVSEIMLQQTQVSRVTPKYTEFLISFPNVHTLARATLADVLKVWSGLGYNRRAKYLHETAKVVAELGGSFPKTVEQLELLPGVGKNTAGAIMAYAYNIPAVFIETNIRTVYIHYFFADQAGVSDKQILPIIEASIDAQNPREFYWALMDLGTHIKKSVGNVARVSKHYTRQSHFDGSIRQVRGKVLKQLGVKSQSLSELMDSIADERLVQVLDDLQNEKLISVSGKKYQLG